MDSFVDAISSERKPVKILMIGNGFDLAHDLPTSYINFLDFTTLMQAFSEEDMSIFDWENLYLSPKLNKICNKLNFHCYKYIDGYIKHHIDMERAEEFIVNIEDNMWFRVFNKKISKSGEDWIDYEI